MGCAGWLAELVVVLSFATSLDALSDVIILGSGVRADIVAFVCSVCRVPEMKKPRWRVAKATEVGTPPESPPTEHNKKVPWVPGTSTHASVTSRQLKAAFHQTLGKDVTPQGEGLSQPYVFEDCSGGTRHCVVSHATFFLF